MKLSAVFLTTILAGAIGCKSRPTAPSRPPIVPNAAVWAGGLDGGSFFECDVDSQNDVNRCIVYNDHTGDVVGGGYFRLRGVNHAARRSELQFRFFDGHTIALSGGTLMPVQPVPSTAIPKTAVFANGLFIDCREVASRLANCSIYRPDGAMYFEGTFAPDTTPSGELEFNFKYFDLTDRTIYMENGGSLVAR